MGHWEVVVIVMSRSLSVRGRVSGWRGVVGVDGTEEGGSGPTSFSWKRAMVVEMGWMLDECVCCGGVFGLDTGVGVER